MDVFFTAIEQTSLSVWVREDDYAYFIALIFHALGMALLVGGGIVISLRVLLASHDAALHKLRGFLPVLWLGAAMAIVSGILLLAAYPAKALTNPVFAVKFVCLIAGALLLRKLPTANTANRGSRAIAAIALGLWLAGVAAGKLLLHTYTVLTVS